MAAEEEVTTLSKHDTVAVFRGLEQRPCRHLTSLCPDRCGHALRLARFDIADYTSYEKLGEYGDERAATHYLTLSGGQDAVPSTSAELISTLHPGDRVRLAWHHDYVTSRDGGKFPRRPLVRLERL